MCATCLSVLCNDNLGGGAQRGICLHKASPFGELVGSQSASREISMRSSKDILYKEDPEEPGACISGDTQNVPGNDPELCCVEWGLH